jgi:tricorn protease
MKQFCWFILVFLMVSVNPVFARNQPVTGISGLTVSSDGQTLAFSYLGDIWAAPSSGGLARRLTVHPADDRDPVYSPDGRYLAFSSNRSGNMDVFIMEAFGGEPRRLTYHSVSDMVTQFSPSGDFIVFNAYRDFREQVTWKISVDGHEPEILCPVESAHGKLSPDGTQFLYQKGYSGEYRRGYRGPGASNIWLMDMQTLETRPVTETDWIDRNPEWFPDGTAIAYISEKDNAQNLYKHYPATGTTEAITTLSDGFLSDMTVSPDGTRIYFCLNSQAHVVDTDGAVHAIPIWTPADRATSMEERLEFSTCGDFVLSPDNRQIVLEYRGDLFGLSPDGGRTQTLTETPWRESNPRWHPAENALYYLGDRNRKSQLYRLVPDDSDKKEFHKARFFKETLVFNSDIPILFFEISPDGKSVVYSCADGVLARRGIDGSKPDILLTAKEIYSLDFSPDSRWITYVREFGGLHYDTYVLNLDTRQEYQVSRLYGQNSDTRFSKDGRQLLTVSGDFRNNDIYAVWLSKLDHERYEDEEEEDKDAENGESSGDTKTVGTSVEKEQENAAAIKPVVMDLDSIHTRFRRLVNWSSNTHSPLISADGKTLFFVSNAMGKTQMYAMDIKGNRTENPRILADLNPVKYYESKDGASLYYRTDSAVGKLDIKTGKPAPIPIKGVMRLDRKGEFLQMYNEAWSAIKYGFYDSDLHGVDWEAAYQKYLPLVEQTRTAWEFNTVVRRLIGELNASHLGIWGGDDPDLPSVETGRLGLRLGPYTEGRGYIIREVLPDTPADREASKIRAGEYLRAINRVVLTPAEPMARHLNDTVGELVELDIVTSGTKPQHRQVSLKPMGFWEHETASYKYWIRKNQEMIDRLSGGRIGYLHIRSMNRSSLEQFRNDVFGLHWEKDALIIDVRRNPGGYIHNELLSHLTGESFGISIPRLGEAKEHPDYVWRKPSVVVIDEQSFSDAEVFPNGYQTLGIGKVIGMPTFGGVIGTGGIRLLNNAWFRLPGTGWYTSDGRNMENSGAVPDILVERSPLEDLEGRDSQLERAVEVLLSELPVSTGN